MTYPYEGSSTEPTHAFGIDSAFDEPAQEAVPDAFDEHDAGLDENDASDRKPARRKPARSAARLSAAQVRRVLAQAELIQAQDNSVRELLAATLGTSASTEDLVVATISSTKAGEVIVELLAVASEQDPFKPVVLAHALLSERDSARRVWALLTALGKVSGSIPGKDIQAATTVAAAAKDLSLDDLAGLELVTELLS